MVQKKEEVGQADFSQGKFVLEDVQDPGNGNHHLTADAAGFTGVLFQKNQISTVLRPYVPCKAVISICLFAGCRVKASRKLKRQVSPVLATTLSKDSVDYRELPPIENFVLVMGNEGQGISPLMAESADQLVHISMKGRLRV